MGKALPASIAHKEERQAQRPQVQVAVVLVAPGGDLERLGQRNRHGVGIAVFRQDLRIGVPQDGLVFGVCHRPAHQQIALFDRLAVLAGALAVIHLHAHNLAAA